MKMFNKESLSGFFGLNDDFDDSDNDSYKEERKPKSSPVQKKPDFRQEKQTNDYNQSSSPSSSQAENVRASNKVVTMDSGKTKSNTNSYNTNSHSIKKDASNNNNRLKNNVPINKISIIEPRTYTESKNIAKCIFRNEIVIINFHLVEENQARRIVDFMTGVVYGLDGDIQRLADEIFICTPNNMEIDSVTAKSLLNSQFAEY